MRPLRALLGAVLVASGCASVGPSVAPTWTLSIVNDSWERVTVRLVDDSGAQRVIARSNAFGRNKVDLRDRPGAYMLRLDPLAAPQRVTLTERFQVLPNDLVVLQITPRVTTSYISVRR